MKFTVRQAQAEPLVALTLENRLLTFDSATPTRIDSNMVVTGLQAGESLRGIDYRPANGMLYGLSNQSRLYTINPLTGIALFASQLSTPLSSPISSAFGVDFDPVNDRLRVVNVDGQNLRVNVDTGETVVDGSINPSNRFIMASAYTNNFAGATETTLYGIDNGTGPGFAEDGIVYRIGSLMIQNPSTGTVTQVGGPEGLGLSYLNPFSGFDISGQTGIAYAALIQFSGTPQSRLYTINLATGRVTSGSQIGFGPNGFIIQGLAAPVGRVAAVPEPATMILLTTGLAGVAAKVRRRRKANQDSSSASKHSNHP